MRIFFVLKSFCIYIQESSFDFCWWSRIFALVSITISAVSKIRWFLSNCACLVWLNCSEADPNYPEIISRSGEIISVNYCLFFAIRSTYVFLSLYSCGMLQILVASSFLSFIWTVKCYCCIGLQNTPHYGGISRNWTISIV